MSVNIWNLNNDIEVFKVPYFKILFCEVLSAKSSCDLIKVQWRYTIPNVCKQTM